MFKKLDGPFVLVHKLSSQSEYKLTKNFCVYYDTYLYQYYHSHLKIYKINKTKTKKHKLKKKKKKPDISYDDKMCFTTVFLSHNVCIWTHSSMFKEDYGVSSTVSRVQEVSWKTVD